jgi:hypothetical protein
MSENNVSNSVSQTPEIVIFIPEIWVKVEKVRKNKYVLKTEHDMWEDRDLNGILVIVEAMFGKKYSEMIRQALGEWS